MNIVDLKTELGITATKVMGLDLESVTDGERMELILQLLSPIYYLLNETVIEKLPKFFDFANLVKNKK